MSQGRTNSVIHRDPEILGGTPVFMGTRVPLKNLIDYLEGGHAVDEFLDDFPSVSREQVVAFLEEALDNKPRQISHRRCGDGCPQ
jgi:uncharacterized protein (DUF433 family)